MNTNTRLRLWKETRALLPMWAAVFFFMGATTCFDKTDALPWSLLAYVFGSALLGASIVGQEFQHRTMSVLLAQPVPRLQIWYEKLAVLGTALLGLMLSFTLLTLAQWSAGKPRFRSDADAFAAACIWLAPMLLGFCTSPTFALLTRSTIGGVTLTFLCPMVLFLGSGWLLPEEFSSPRRWVVSAAYYASVFGSYACLLMLMGRRRFERLEDDRSQPQELQLPTVRELQSKWTGALFVLGVRRSPTPSSPTNPSNGEATLAQDARATSSARQSTQPCPRSALEHLIRKEIRLQQPAIVVAAGLVALWLMLLASATTHLITDRGILLLPSVLLGLGIPVIAGIVSTAEERNLGVHEWHLTLPVSARLLWTVKVLVALGVNAALGILLPGLLAHASAWLANNPQLAAEIPGHIVPPFLIASLVLLAPGLYASTASSNPMRALIGTVVLFVAGGLVSSYSDHVVNTFGRGRLEEIILRKLTQAGSSDPLYSIYVWRWPLIWSFFALWLFFLGLESYRRALESVLQPARRIAVLIGWVCVFIFAAIF
ncbi:MAG: ABC transporter permease [Limisphaerales bacterium]